VWPGNLDRVVEQPPEEGVLVHRSIDQVPDWENGDKGLSENYELGAGIDGFLNRGVQLVASQSRNTGAACTAAARNLGYTSPGRDESSRQQRYDNSRCLVSGPDSAPSNKRNPPTARMTIWVYS
jgi:hypothetical protein